MQININTDRIKKHFEENPILAIAAAGALLSGAAKLMNANTARHNSKTWKNEVDRRRRSA